MRAGTLNREFLEPAERNQNKVVMAIRVAGRRMDVGGTFVLTPLRPMVPELAREIERLREESDLSTKEMIARLRDDRVAVVAESAGRAISDRRRRPGP